MRRTIVLLLGLLLPLSAHADVSRENFLLRTTGDLLALCSVRSEDPNAIAAIHFCHGYALGLRHYAEATGQVFRGALFCPPAGRGLTRDESVRSFVGWATSHTQYMNEPPFDGLLRWAMATWPCPG